MFTEFALELPATLPGPNSLVRDLNLAYSGLSDKPIDFYVRNNCQLLWEFVVNAITEGGLHSIEGAPGVGKSVETYWCATVTSRSLKKNLIYIHATLSSTSVIVYSNEIYKSTTYPPSDQATVIRFLQNATVNETVDVIVVDGTNEALIACALSLWSKTRTIIICTSFQAINLSSEQERQVAPSYFTMLSWTEEEYLAAIAVGLKIDNFQEMFFYGGSSIRYVLWPTTAQLIKFLDRKIAAVSNVQHLLTGSVGKKSNDAVNSLMCIVEPNVSIFLSEYVTRKLSSLCEKATILRCKSILPDNPSWQGWVAELDVISRIRTDCKLTVYDKDSEPEIWAGRVLEFDSLDERQVLNCPGKTFLLPLRWNQGGFDFLFKSAGHTVQAANVTIGSSHSLKLRHLVPVLKHWHTKQLDFAFVCNKKNFAKFKLPLKPVPPSTIKVKVLVRKVSCEPPAKRPRME